MGGIDLDPATSEIANRTVQAATFYTADDDGRTKPWSGRVWMNPPYAQPLMGDFADKLAKSVEAGDIDAAIVLVNNATETAWFHTLVGASAAICFPRSRIRFLDPEGNPNGAPLQGQAIFYVGEDVEAFRAGFESFGFICGILPR
jgi:ParB family chromosome partitioning protein